MSNRSLRVACMLAVCAFPPLARAESSVTLYGIVDEFFQYVNTGNGYTAAIGSSGQWASRIGLRGHEDIGGGNFVSFDLQNGFNPNDGTFASPGSLFNRQAWIGVGGNWGEVHVGRQNSPIFNDQGGLDAFGASTQASGFSNMMTYAVRTSNTVSYTSPTLSGVQFSVYVGFGDAGGLRSAGASYQADVTYSHGPFSAVAAAQAVRSADNSTLDRTAEVGASYQIGKTTVYLGWSGAKWDDLALDVNVYGISAVYQLTPAQAVSLGGTLLHDETGHGDNARQIAALYTYSFSKRTSLYGAVSFLQNEGNASYRLAGSANAGLPLAYAGADARGFQLGVVHRF
ncbi:porin [Paraburkholderia sp. C35]|uniref:porin n=1 Tax=Paraburkholderia sp. C35 TaxID=2126993 RepID=UPI000D69D195|nr:porin [Paraburkholderia sp. C35]